MIIRNGVEADSSAMAAFLNAAIRIGGTTTHVDTVSAEGGKCIKSGLLQLTRLSRP